ncbi:FHA domain-containing protein [Aggregatilinea lenta]|uniref:FHA domain-containing protein n=1 Tax=Aggregatilinea lenta TaxID=913108 RepID=UPI0013C36DCE|nr:FHA domain-containing protein [Aggregatilinea lenta]
MELLIMVMSGPDDGRTITLNPERGDGFVAADGTWTIVLGRREECDIGIPFDTQVSRQHALLRLTTDQQIWLADASSRNGTYVGKTRIEEPTLVTPGELFRLGRTWLRIQPESEL